MRRRSIVLALVATAVVAALMVAWPGADGPRFDAASVLAVGEQCTPARPHASGTTVENVSTSGGSRPFRLHVPPSYTGADPVPVVISMHGAGSNAFEQEIYSNFSVKSDAEGFIVAYPEGTVTGITFTHFNAWQFPTPPEPDDVAYVGAILDYVGAQLCVDRSRVYSTGMSNGAMMSVRLACSLSNRIAAIGPVAGSYYPPMSATTVNPGETCPHTAPRPVIAFHGTADTSVPFNGGAGTNGVDFRLPIDDNTPAEDVIADWAAHNGCAGARQETQIDTEVRLIEYGACADGAIVQLYAVDGGGHTWPGSFDVPSLGYTTQQIDATDLIWAFFTQYTLPDADADLVPDDADNCLAEPNFPQTNSDPNFMDNSPPYGAAADDKTWPMSDTLGDACDDDDDNDGLTDAEELSGSACGTVPTDPLVRDSDGDRYLDRAECVLGTDPLSAAAAPATVDCGPAGDADGDKISDRLEFCFYGTDAGNVDTDGDRTLDGGTDGCEVASINADRIVSSGDQGMLAAGISLSVAYHANIDLNKDGVLSSGDQGLMASFVTPASQCP
jgi:polyhydroxybutyrate depolymerase